MDERLREMALAGHGLGEAGFWRAQAALAGLFDLLRAAEPQDDGAWSLPAPGSPTRSVEGVAEAAHEFFRAHLAEKVTLAAVAGHLAMSPSAFSHRYARETGRPPMAALTSLRIEFAKGLLLRGLKMEAIAAQTGFYDAFHFSKTFKRLCGVSPSRFRRDFRRSVLGRGPASASR
jgi:transcriptional regulator GlxA family with amidase domain